MDGEAAWALATAQLVAARRRVAALLPVDDDGDALAHARTLARRLAARAGAPATVVIAGAAGAAAGAGDAEVTRAGGWSFARAPDGLVLARAAAPRPPGAAATALPAALAACAVGPVVCDLTGLARTGEHVAAAALVDAVILLARARRTRAAALRALAGALPGQRLLGVVVCG